MIIHISLIKRHTAVIDMMTFRHLSCVYTTVLSRAERAPSTVVRVYTHNLNASRAREEVGAG